MALNEYPSGLKIIKKTYSKTTKKIALHTIPGRMLLTFSRWRYLSGWQYLSGWRTQATVFEGVRFLGQGGLAFSVFCTRHSPICCSAEDDVRQKRELSRRYGSKKDSEDHSQSEARKWGLF